MDKKELQILVLQSFVLAVVVYLLLTRLLPLLKHHVSAMTSSNSSKALQNVQSHSNTGALSLASLEREAENLRREYAKRGTVVSSPRVDLITAEKGYRISDKSEKKFKSNTARGGENIIKDNEGCVEKEVIISSSKSKEQKKFRLKDKYSSEGSGTTSNKIKNQNHQTLHSDSTVQSQIYSRNPVETYAVTQNSQNREVERQLTLSEQDVAYEASVQSDIWRRIIQERREANFARLVDDYSKVHEEPDPTDPEAVTVIFKISDDVYAMPGSKVNSKGLKHKKILHRFFASDSVHSLFLFIYSHIYMFSGYEERYRGGEVPPIFACGMEFVEDHENVNFDLICSFPKLVLHSPKLVYSNSEKGDDCLPQGTIFESGIRSNTLLTLRPSAE